MARVAVELEDGGALAVLVGLGEIQQAHEEGLALFEMDVDLLLVAQAVIVGGRGQGADVAVGLAEVGELQEDIGYMR